MTRRSSATGSNTSEPSRRIAAWLLGVLVCVGVFAPLLATDRPLLARIDGVWSWPAFAAWAGEPVAPPSGWTTWSAWWSSLESDDGRAATDLAWTAPLPIDPHRTDSARLFARPDAAHLLGNDEVGRDVLARIVHGARTAVWVGGLVVLSALFVGVALGAIAGLRGGWIDVVVLRLVELTMCFPALLFVLGVAAFVATSQAAMIAVLAATSWPSFARVVRGEFLSLREREFVRTARQLGVGTAGIVFRHMLPQVRGPIAVVAGFVAAHAIVVESTLRFLGLGAGEHVVSWGQMLARYRDADASAWHLWVFPAITLAGTIVSLHVVGDRSARR